MKIEKYVDNYVVEIEILSGFNNVIVSGKVFPFLKGDAHILFEVLSDSTGRVERYLQTFEMKLNKREADRVMDAISIAKKEMDIIEGVINDLSNPNDAVNLIMDELSYKNLSFDVNELIDIKDAKDVISGDMSYMYLKFAQRALYYILLTPNINSVIDHGAINYSEISESCPEVTSKLLGDYLVRSSSFDWILSSLRNLHTSKKKFGSERGRKLEELAFSIVASIFKRASHQMEYSDNEKSAEDVLRIIKIINVVRNGASLKINN